MKDLRDLKDLTRVGVQRRVHTLTLFQSGSLDAFLAFFRFVLQNRMIYLQGPDCEMINFQHLDCEMINLQRLDCEMINLQRSD